MLMALKLNLKPFLAQIRFNPRFRHSKHFIFLKEKEKRKKMKKISLRSINLKIGVDAFRQYSYIHALCHVPL